MQRIAASSLILAFACGGSDPEPNATTDAATEPAETTDADDDSSTDAPTTASTTDEPTTAPDTSGSADTTEIPATFLRVTVKVPASA